VRLRTTEERGATALTGSRRFDSFARRRRMAAFCAFPPFIGTKLNGSNGIPVVSELDCDSRDRRHVDADSVPDAGAGMGYIPGDAGTTDV
jgi:hypothetical protein